jgi:alpha-D-ribose 1-methylphosphonate 5-triphosphate synthase subunit PhnG
MRFVAAPDRERKRNLKMTASIDNENRNSAEDAVLNSDYTLCECELEPLKQLVSRLEQVHQVEIRKSPSICLTMIPAEDSLEAQKFYLGEALTIECEVAVDGQPGFGLCLGEEPVRAYCIAVVDALLHGGEPVPSEAEAFLLEHGQRVARRDQDEFDLVLQTQVDFKLMEEE